MPGPAARGALLWSRHGQRCACVDGRSGARGGAGGQAKLMRFLFNQSGWVGDLRERLCPQRVWSARFRGRDLSEHKQSQRHALRPESLAGWPAPRTQAELPSYRAACIEGCVLDTGSACPHPVALDPEVTHRKQRALCYLLPGGEGHEVMRPAAAVRGPHPVSAARGLGQGRSLPLRVRTAAPSAHNTVMNGQQ